MHTHNASRIHATLSHSDDLLRSRSRRQLYVMETKLAEAQLSPAESQMWENMKSDYMVSKGIDEPTGPPPQQKVRVRGRKSDDGSAPTK